MRLHIHLPDWLDRLLYEAWELDKGDVQMFVRRNRLLRLVDVIIILPNGTQQDVWRFDRITKDELTAIIDAGAAGIYDIRLLAVQMLNSRKGSYHQCLATE